MADLSLQDLYDMLSDWKLSTNLGNSPLTYLNPRARLEISSLKGPLGSFGSPAAGWVSQLPGLNNKIVFSRPNQPNDQYGLLSLLAHESAHTTQPIGLGSLFSNKFINSAPYEGYDPTNFYPHSKEVLASLREKEAMAPIGKQWRDTIDGGDYLNALKKANPSRSEASLVQEVDRQMFPEFSVMHESPEPSVLSKLFKKFK